MTMRDEASPVAELRRIDLTGTIWFAAGLVAAATVVAALMLAGWRPAQLPVGAAVAWWAGAALVVLGLGGFAWAGCPVFAFAPEVAHRQKAFTIRAGLAAYAVGGVLSCLVVLLGP
jgi:hypothetical protein